MEVGFNRANNERRDHAAIYGLWSTCTRLSHVPARWLHVRRPCEPGWAEVGRPACEGGGEGGRSGWHILLLWPLRDRCNAKANRSYTRSGEQSRIRRVAPDSPVRI